MRALLFCCFIVSLYAKEGKFQASTYVGGKLENVTYTYSTKNEPLFTSQKFRKLNGKILRFAGPNRVLFQYDKTTEELELIGLMDVSTGSNPEMRNFALKELAATYTGLEVVAYLPRDYKEQKLSANHAYLLNDTTIINHEILSLGLGVLPPGQDFYYPLQESFEAAMNQAVSAKLGVWGMSRPQIKLSSEELRKKGIIAEPVSSGRKP